MTKKEFQTLTGSVLLLDGATGTNLMAAGMPRGVCTEDWVSGHRDVIVSLQSAYIEAGSQVIYAPTFGANRINLSTYGMQDRVEELNRTLAGYALDVAGDRAYVAGDLTTTGKIMEPEGPLTYEQAFEAYQEQAQVLSKTGVDLFVVETMTDLTETIAAVDAVMSVCDLPVMCSMTVEADGSMFGGGNVIEAAASLEAAGADAVGVNCSVGPDSLLSVIRNIRENVSIPVLAKPNAGVPAIDGKGNAVYAMQPEAFAGHMEMLVRAGASIIGGCCGTTPDFISALAHRMNIQPPGRIHR